MNLPYVLVNTSGPKHLNIKAQGPSLSAFHQDRCTLKDAEVTKYDIGDVLSDGWDNVDAQSAGNCAATLSPDTQQV